MDRTDINLLSVCNDKNINNAAIARADAEEILAGYHFRLLPNYLAGNGNPKRDLWHLVKRFFAGLRMYHVFSSLPSGCMVIQYPFVPSGFRKLYMPELQRQRIIYLLHDVDSLRNYSRISAEQDIAWLNMAAVLIVHNRKMREKLLEMGVTKPRFVELEIFDYLVAGEIQPKEFQRRVSFAGNLGKSAFLPLWLRAARNYAIDLYGMNWQASQKYDAQVEYHGSFPAKELPNALQGGFGLVWDGDSIETESGVMGEYNRYNNPHKFSLYLAAGLPVIVWKEAAIAEIVEKYKIGLCVNGLEEINAYMDDITEEKYKELCSNIRPLQLKVRQGYFLKTAMDKALEMEEMDK